MTTTSTTSTSTTTASSTASIVKTLGSGSGLDTGTIVAELVDASFSVKTKRLAAQSDTLTAQISGIAKLKSGITQFDTALKTLVKGGTLATQPTSSATAVLTAAATGTASVAGLSARVSVVALAAAQAATTNTPVDRTAAFRQGNLNVTIGGVTTAIAIGSGDATLNGVAAKINAAALGLTATIITDGNGARLTVKGATGGANAFTIDASDTDPTATGISLSTLAVGSGATGTTIGSNAADAQVTLDGATFSRASNTITDLVPGVRLELQGVGTTTLGSTAPTANISQSVSDFVSAFNELHTTLASALDAKTGELRTDPASRTLLQSLANLTTTSLATTTGGAPRTLADIGVRTERDGSLSLDTSVLSRALTRFPDAVEAMFADGVGASNGGLSAALGAIAARATDQTTGFDAETTRYTAAQQVVTDEQTAVSDSASKLSDRLTKQFSAMDTRVAAYKATQDFLTQQVAAWNKSS